MDSNEGEQAHHDDVNRAFRVARTALRVCLRLAVGDFSQGRSGPDELVTPDYAEQMRKSAT